MSWSSRTRPLLVGAASCFDLSGSALTASRRAVRSPEGLRLVWAGMLGMFALTVTALVVGAGLVLAGVPEAGGLAILGPLSAPSLTVLANRDVPPSRALLGRHVSAVVFVVGTVSALVCFFDAHRTVSAAVFAVVAVSSALVFLSLRRR